MSELTVPTAQPETVLTKFIDRLRIPPTLRPSPHEALPSLTVCMRTTQVQLHSQLPPTTVWAYDGHYPGPTFDVRRGQRIRVAWVNEITGKSPVTDVHVDGDIHPMNDLGLSGATPNPDVVQLPAWTVVHLHGGRTSGGHDGWTENAVLSGGVQLSEYPNDQPAMGLWYHDHAMDVTRFNVMAGLAGMYLIRDDEEAALNLPSGEHEVPLIIQDGNVTTEPNGTPTGNLLHKTAGPLPFFGPLTLVNGVLWPHLEVQPRWYRFRVLNASLTRVYRLILLGQDDQPVSPKIIQQIGTDQGLLPKPLLLPEQGLVLAPAERADVLINFRGLAGESLRLVSTAGQPFNGEPLSGAKPGQPNPNILLPEPDVMQFRVSPGLVTDPFTLPTTVSRSFVRLSHDTLPKDHEHRLVVLTQNPQFNRMNMLPFELWEMEDVTGKHAVTPGKAEDGIIQIKGPGDGEPKTYQRKSRSFLDTVNFLIKLDTWEQWRFLNLGANAPVTDLSMIVGRSVQEQWSMLVGRSIQEQWGVIGHASNIRALDTPSAFLRIAVTHPMHLHLVRFQALSRDVYDITGFNPGEGGTEQPIAFKKHGDLEPIEQGWKDVIRVGPGERGKPQTTGEIVSIAAQFSGGSGQFMYHCHLIQHEDEGMMRPFVVMPAEVMKLDPGMRGGMPM